jgi:RimJ/RimL family protein N-acetyltransferase
VNRLQYELFTFLASVFRRERLLFFEKILAVPYINADVKVDIDVKIFHCDEFSKNVDKLRTLKIDVEKNYGCADLFAIAEIDGKTVHIRGVMLNKINVESIEREIRLNSDSACLYGAYTAPEYRGMGVAPKVSEEIFRYLYQLGFKRGYGYISSDNLPSLRYARKVGYRKIGEVNFIKIFKLKWYRFKGETKNDYDTLTKMFSI